MGFDTSDFLSGVSALRARLNEATEDIVEDGLGILTEAIMDNAPVRTGTLRRSVQATPVRQNGEGIYEGQVGPTVIYARIRELGGDIYPRPRLVIGKDGRIYPHVLSWVGPDGRRRFAHHVHQVGRPYVKPAVEASRDPINDMARERWAAAITES